MTTSLIEPIELAEATEIPWTAVLMFEGVETGDGRIFDEVTNRELPLPLMAQTILADGHEGAAIAGRIDTITKVGTEVLGSGVFDSGEFGTEIARLVEARTLRGVSVDLGDVGQVEFEVRESDDNGIPTDVLARYTGISILGATVLAHPAFAGAEIAVGESSPSPSPGEIPDGEEESEAVPAQVASGGPSAPPASYFHDPRLTERTFLTVDDDGRIYGHIYGWGECHIGSEAVCITAPPSATDYAYFRTGEVVLADGSRVSTGPLVLDADHARTAGLSWMQAKDHYANTGLAVADIACGDDEHGIWIAGVVRPTATPEQVYVLRAGDVSPDWRRIGGHLEMVAALSVNCGGFPNPRALVADGQVMALTAAVGTLHRAHASGDCGCDESAALVARLDRVERIVAALHPAAIEALTARLDA
jgi:hypothetical protein